MRRNVSIYSIAWLLVCIGIIHLPRIVLGMCWDPYDENAYIDHCYHDSRSPLDMIRSSFIEHYHCTSIDDNLHKELDLENPECE